jgi:ABC-type multidrug transport system fused ATPase/permease subunit
LPREISPGAASRRRLLADILIAIGIAFTAFVLAAGLGIIAFVALPTLLVLLVWIATEATVKGVRRRRLSSAFKAGTRESRAP